MNAYFTFRRAAIAAAGGLVAALTFGGGAQAVDISGDNFFYTTPKTGYFGIDHMAMSPDTKNSAATFFINWGTGIDVGGEGCFNTGVNLPQGATITALTVWYSSGTVGNVFAALYRHKFSDGATDNIGEKTFKDNSTTRKSGNVPIAAASAVVNNNQYSYGFGTCFDVSDRFHTARITYTYGNAGD